METSLEEVANKQKFIELKVDSNTKDIVALRKVVLGNGEKGMDEVARETQTTIEKFIADYNKEKDKKETRQEKLLIGGILALLANVVGFIGTVVTLMFRFWPILLEIEHIVKASP